MTACSEDHPRLRGEHRSDTSGYIKIPGSPPLTRGTQRFTSNFAPSSRITPAYAGNTCSIVSYHSIIWDHPRLRGEHVYLRICTVTIMGSPPLTRGTPLADISDRRKCGITPAYAGNTEVKQGDIFSDKDHPRLRGEHRLLYYRQTFSKGSPPLTRGTLNCLIMLMFFWRITPAYAGNTIHFLQPLLYYRDHPRIRGEHKSVAWSRTRAQGSPPHTRGTLYFIKLIECIRQITPAYAGNTLLRLHQHHFQ